MRFDILTLFPEMFAGPLTESIIKRAVRAGLIDLRLHNIRDYTTDKHHTADDAPYGGGAGMVMKAEPLAAAIRAVTRDQGSGVRDQESDAMMAPDPRPLAPGPLVVLMTPAGELFSQRIARELAASDRLVLVCGHYEGIDERVREALVDRELSIGDYVLTGGELAAHYTRPAFWEGREVPPVLRAGHHGQVALWRRQQQLRRTLERRPDLLATADLTAADRAYLRSLGWSPDVNSV